MTTPAHLRRRIAHVYRTRTAADHHAGARWYPTARALVTRWAHRYHLPRETVAGIIAAISPQCDWPTNKRLARAILQGRRPGSLGGALRKNLEKAARIRRARARDVARYFPHGPKVQAFARNLAGDDSEQITIDRHAAGAAGGRTRKWGSLTPKQYATLAQAYRDVAQALHLPPARLQAIIWVSWKRRTRRKDR